MGFSAAETTKIAGYGYFLNSFSKKWGTLRDNLLSLFFLALCIAPLAGEENSAELHLDLESAYRAALSTSPELLYSSSLTELLSGQISPHLRSRVPRLNFSYTGNSAYSAGRPFIPHHRIGVGATIEIYNGGRTGIEAKMRRLHIASLREGARLQSSHTLTGISELFSSIFLSKKRISLLNTSYDSAFRYLRIAQKRVADGDLLSEEVSSLVLELREIGLAVKREESKRTRLLTRLEELTTGDRDRRKIVPKGDLPFRYEAIGSGNGGGIEELLRSARKHSPELILSMREEREAELRLSENRRRLLPSIKFFSAIHFEGRDFPPLTPLISVGLSITTAGDSSLFSYTGSTSVHRYGRGGEDSLTAEFPLYPGSVKGEIEKLKLQRARKEGSEKRRSLENRIRERYQELELQQRGLSIRNDSLDIGRRREERTRLLYENGKVSLTRLFEAMHSHVEKKIHLHEAVVQLFLSEQQLLLLCGREETARARAHSFFSLRSSTGGPQT